MDARMYAMCAHPMSNIVNNHDVSYHNYANDTHAAIFKADIELDFFKKSCILSESVIFNG